MDIAKELQNIINKKKGNKELALFCGGVVIEGWALWVGNPTNCVALGETEGEITGEGETIEKAIIAVKKKMGIT